MRSTKSFFLVAVIGINAFGLSLGNPAAAAQAGESTWRLGTADTEATIRVANNQVLVGRLANPQAGRNWLAKDSLLPLMSRVWTGNSEIKTVWVFQAGAMDGPSGCLTLAFTNAQPQLALRSIWRARPGRGPIEHWIEIDNRSGQRVAIAQQESLSLAGLRPGGDAVLWWINRGGNNASTQGGTFSRPLAAGLDLKLASDCQNSASPVPWLALQIGSEQGLYVGWEFSGLGRVHARSGGDGRELAIDVGNHPDFKTDVEPGETFCVPPAFVGCYAGELDEGSYSLHRFILEKLRPRLPADCPDPILAYNLYLDVGGNRAREADVLRSARTCHDLGFEAFMPDAMWFPQVGDWRWDPQRFPKGVKPIEQYVHARGMRMALWCAWTNGGLSADPGALSVRGPVGHPDWFNGNYGPGWKPAAFTGGQLCLGSAEARQWAVAKTQSLVGRQGLDYLKHDCGPITNHCNKTTHRHHYKVDTSYWATMGYYEVQEKLRQAFPGLILENCSGGGHIKDFGIIRRTHYTVTTDTLSNLPDRQSIYDSTFVLPPLVLQAYTYDNFYPVKGDGPGTFLWRSGMMSAWQIDPTDTPKWSAEQCEAVRRSVKIYKDWIRPMLADVKVHHVLPRPDGVHWDGMFYWSPCLNHGTLYVFRPQSPEDRQTIRLKGLDPRQSFRLWCEDGSITPGVRSGAELMDVGVSIRLPRPYTSDLVFVKELGQKDGEQKN